MKRRVALSMAVVMAATLLPAASPKPYRAKAAEVETELSNPVIEIGRASCRERV